jgi:hypothetical protein
MSTAIIIAAIAIVLILIFVVKPSVCMILIPIVISV